jgi:serine/threonine-protein kinase
MSPSSRFCPACGAAADSSADATVTLVKSSERTPARSQGATVSPDRARTAMGRLHLSDSLHQARFLPGMMLHDRYRIVGLLGKGGMGEVYRADDMRLGQAVALKFLPEVLRSNPARLEMFFEEVRLARQVSHPHVCRVYDVGEIDGAPFLTMEYIDGEDLASLLRRIGRLPQERAVQVARQICSGLAAIHDKGILHRDLKPANVMLDGRGAARITDFGLAVLAGGVAADMLRSGTPAYMAPEQLGGEEPTVRSDVYALGLVLYELFTGRGAFEADSIEELTRQRRETRPDPSSQVQNLDPIVERVLLRCLENDPRDRPGSALAVAAALPGGDPLAAALAAGETPSPEMVAAAGEPGAIRPVAGAACLAAILIGMILIAMMVPSTTMLGLAPVRKSPAALEERARQVLEALQFTEPAADHEHDLAYDADYLRWIERTDPGARRWEAISANRPPAVFYFYRQSPRPLEALGPARVVRPNDPPLTVAGMVNVVLDTEGRLLELHAVPPQVEPQDAPSPAEADPSRLFQLAGLDFSAFRPVASAWTPPLYADTRAAWEGPHPALRDGSVRVESAFYRGRPVYFELVGPWTRPVRAQTFEQSRGVRLGQTLNVLIVLSVLVGAMLLARRNVRLGRGDRRGAFRVGVAVFLMTLSLWLLRAHHGASLQSEWILFIWGASLGLFQSGLLWLLYLALEPFIRRRWPDSIISWSRLLAGWWRDPRIGRDILVGGAFGMAMALVDRLRFPVAVWLGLPPGTPSAQQLDLLMGGRFVMAVFINAVISALIRGIFFLFFLFLGRWQSGARHRIIGAGIFLTISTVMQFLFMGTGPVAVHLSAAVITSILLLTVLSRFGFLACISCMFFALWNTPFALSMSAWYAPVGILAAMVPLALAVFGLVTSLGARPAELKPALAD